MGTFENATLMITGGTGSFGNTVLKHFLMTDIGQIRFFSRDEKKQDDMRHELQAKYPEYARKVKFYIGDVRDLRSLADAMPGVDEVMEFKVSGDKIQAVHMLPGYTHNIINLSDTENLVTLMWANELFDPKKPDTFFEKV